MDKLQINHKRKVNKWRTECKIEIHMVIWPYKYILCTPIEVSIFQVKQKELWESLTQLLLRPSEAIQYWITASKGHAEQNTIFANCSEPARAISFYHNKESQVLFRTSGFYSRSVTTADASNKYRHISRNAINMELCSVFPIRPILK